ncbi:MAG: hypothetical protein HY272_04925 [Gammaproteobacteria bacterium]|nr:hypothetical protein [Gammaproteobacteria bacterium]
MGQLQCWRCGAVVEGVPLPLTRSAQCQKCHADLHVCRMCKFYDPSRGQACREPIAGEVKDKVRANFCELLQPRLNAYQPPNDQAQKSRGELERLFGGAASPQSELSAEEQARKALEELFGKK